MAQLSENAEAALLLHNAQKSVADRFDGSWWILNDAKWDLIGSLPVGPEHRFILALINAYSRRRMAA